MKRSARQYVAVALLAVGTLGCSANGPMESLSSWNPLARRKWAEDESAGSTFYARMQQLQDLEGRVGRASEAERGKLATQMTTLVGDEDNPLLRRQAVRVLGKLKHPSSEIGLNMAETDAEPIVRHEVCRIRGEQRTREGLQALARVLANDTDQDVRMSAVRQLANYRDAEAYQALGHALGDRDPAMQRLAMNSLENASGKHLGNNAAAWQEFIATGEAKTPPSSLPFSLPSLRWASLSK